MERPALQNSISDYEQRIFMKFGVLLGWSAADIHKNLKIALDKRVLPESTTKRWVKQIKEGRIDVTEDRGGDRSNYQEHENQVKKIKELLEESREWSVRSIESTTGINRETARIILTKTLELNKVYKTWVPYTLSEDQKINRTLACQANLLRFKKTRKVLERTLAIDETWIRMYEPSGRGSKVWLHPSDAREKEVKGGFKEKKRMLFLAMDFTGIAFWWLMPENLTATAEIYRDFINDHIHDWKAKHNIERPILAHDNAKPHVAKVVQQYLGSQNISLWIQPAYSPDFQPCDFNCFGPLKAGLKGHRYTTWEEVEIAIKNVISEGLSRGLYQGVKMLPDRWERVIEEEGEYI